MQDKEQNEAKRCSLKQELASRLLVNTEKCKRNTTARLELAVLTDKLAEVKKDSQVRSKKNFHLPNRHPLLISGNASSA